MSVFLPLAAAAGLAVGAALRDRGSAASGPADDVAAIRAELERPGTAILVVGREDGMLRVGDGMGAGGRGEIVLMVSRRHLDVEHASLYDPRLIPVLERLAHLAPRVRDLRVQTDNTPPITLAEVLGRRWAFRRVPTLYHGTSSALLPRLLTEGLRPRDDTGAAAVYGTAVGARPSLGDRVYLTGWDTMGPALYAGRDARLAHGGERVILRVDGARLAEGRLEPDEDARHATTWLQSLFRLGTVAYRGTIPASALTVFAYPDREPIPGPS